MFRLHAFPQDYVEFYGWCNSVSDIAYSYNDYESPNDYDYIDSATDCLTWCQDKKQNQPWRYFAACEYTGSFCNIYDNPAITGGDGSTDVLCWVFERGRNIKLNLNLLLAL